jgi:hypothetical protein
MHIGLLIYEVEDWWLSEIEGKRMADGCGGGWEWMLMDCGRNCVILKSMEMEFGPRPQVRRSWGTVSVEGEFTSLCSVKYGWRQACQVTKANHEEQ